MGRLNKSVVALTFRFDCDRFLRFRLANNAEKNAKPGVPDANEARRRRPGIQLVTSQGRIWEALCFDDLCDLAKGRVEARLQDEVDEEILRRVYASIENFEELLRRPTPPEFIIECEFNVPGSMSPALAAALASKQLEEAKARPDLLWIRPHEDGVALIDEARVPKRVIHVIDVKLAAEPSLRHFVEVTFYAYALQYWLQEHGLADTYGVCAEGRVWPGTHNAAAFRELVRDGTANGDADPVRAALLSTTKPVPYEVYRPRLRQFLEDRLPRVLALKPDQAPWHVSPKCQLCDFLVHCRDEAKESRVDHLSQMVDLTAGQAEVLRSVGIPTFAALTGELLASGSKWAAAKAQSHRLKGLERVFLARAKAKEQGKAQAIDGRKSIAMPAFSHMGIFITIHFDPGTGITFAIGARRVYFRTKGSPPEVTDFTALVDSVGDGMNPRSERERLLEMCTRIQEWLTELDNTNKLFDDEFDKHTVQFYTWDALEARQFARVLARHIEDDSVAALASFLVRVFPLEGDLRDAEDFRSQPVTIVKSVVNMLVGLPVPFGYTLWDAKNHLAPFINEEGHHVMVRPPYGFHTDMSDQIPFERAYELWQDRIMLRRASLTAGVSNGPLFTRDELRDELRQVTKRHLGALHDVVVALQRDYRAQLLLRKEPFSLKAGREYNLPAPTAQMIIFSQLNALAANLESMQTLAMPIEEREANFHSIRGIVPYYEGDRAGELVRQAREDPRYANRLTRGWDEIGCFAFAVESRDSRVREGDFTLILRNEDSEAPLNRQWYKAAGFKTPAEAISAGARVVAGREYARLQSVLQVTVARLDTAHSPPLVVLLWGAELQRLLSSVNLRNMSERMVLDPIAVDFSTKVLEKALRRVGGKKTPRAAPSKSAKASAGRVAKPASKGAGR